MNINYSLMLLIYLPVLLLLMANLLKDRFELQNKTLLLRNKTLLPATALIFVFISAQVIQSFWYANLINVRSVFPYNLSNVRWFSFYYSCISLFLVLIFLRYIYVVRIQEVFSFQRTHFLLFLKICIFLSVIHVFSEIHSWGSPLPPSFNDIKLLGILHIILFLILTVVIAPIAEEIIFRGLLFSSLYRKTGRYFAIILSSLIWTYTHAKLVYPSVDIPALGVTFIIGVLLVWLYDRTGSLLLPIMVHSFQNSWVIIYFLK